MTDHKKNLEQLIQRLGGVHSTWKVFEDFLAISSISVSNAVDKEPWEEREKEYLSIVSRYSKEELRFKSQILKRIDYTEVERKLNIERERSRARA